MCDAIAVIRHCRIVEQAKTSGLFDNPQSPCTEELIRLMQTLEAA